MDPASLRLAGLSGAVSLDSFARPQSPPSPVTGAPAGNGAVLEVTEASFEADVLVRSTEVPVILDFWASWCGPCRQLSPILEALAAEANGAWILAKIDCDANPALAQAAQVQGIPAVKAVVGGRVVAEFTGALPEPQVRQWIEQLLAAAHSGQFGELAGVEAGDPDAETAPMLDPDLAAGDDALMAGDIQAATEAYTRLRDRPGISAPQRIEALAGLARAALLGRAATLDPQALQDRLRTDPQDVTASQGLADLLVLSDRAEDAFALLIELIRHTAGDERNATRTHLLELFTLIGDADPLVVRARRELANALF